MMTNTQAAEMQASLERLNVALKSAQTQTGGIWTAIGAMVIGTTSSLEANQYLITKCKEAIGQLASLEWLQVMNGTRTYEKWMGHANEVYRTLQSIAPDLGNYTFGGVLSSTYESTAEEVKETAIIGGAIALPILIAVGGLYAFLLFGRR
jgi:hypothetical protein